jgi:hypothetical protein
MDNSTLGERLDGSRVHQHIPYLVHKDKLLNEIEEKQNNTEHNLTKSSYDIAKGLGLTQ